MDDRDAADHPNAPQLKRRRPISNKPQRQPVLKQKSRRSIRPGGFSKLNFYFRLSTCSSAHPE